MVKEERKGLRRRPMEATVLEGEIGEVSNRKQIEIGIGLERL